MQIAVAATSDIPSLCVLLHHLFSQEVEFQPDPAAQRRGLASIIDHPEIGLILTARRNGVIVGMVNLLYTVSTALGERVVWLEDLIVAPDARNQGVGAALMTAAIDHAEKNGFRRITLLTDRDNAAAHDFYRRFGFVGSTMVPFRLSLK